jgi:hypothetical protein
MTAVFFLVSCGGGGADVPPSAATATASSPVRAQRAAAESLSAGAPLTPAALFDWAAQHYSQFFAGAVDEGTNGPYTYRHFAGTNSYLAVSTDGGVYALGKQVSNNQIVRVAPIAFFKCQITPDACPALAVGGSATGTVAVPGEQNWYAIQLVAGQTYAFELEGAATGQGALNDPLVRLFDSAGKQITSDDDSGTSFNSRLVCTAMVSELYYVAAGGFESQTGSYRLSASTATGSTAAQCGNAPGDGSVDWGTAFSAAKLVDQSPTLSPQQAQGWAFTIEGGSLPLEAVFAARTGASLYLTTGANLNACASGGAVNAIASFDGLIGFWQFPLGPGSYGLCVRNNPAQANAVRLELHKQPTVVGFHFSQLRFAPVTRTVAPGDRFTQPATVGELYRTLIEGTSTGGKIFVIRASEVQNFMSGSAFNYFTDLTAACAPAGASAPQLCELLGVDEYVIAYHNDTATAQSVVLAGRDYIPD